MLRARSRATDGFSARTAVITVRASGEEVYRTGATRPLEGQLRAATEFHEGDMNARILRAP